MDNQQTDHIIDSDAKPPEIYSGKTKLSNNENLIISRHQKGGLFKFSNDNVSLFQSEQQKNGGKISWPSLESLLTNENILNATILNYLLKHKELIPESWKDKRVLFCGTIYFHPCCLFCVRYLLWDNGEWKWSYDWAEDTTCFDNNYFVAIKTN